MPVLDTDVFSLHRAGDASIVERVRGIPAEELFISDITVFEFFRGYYALLNTEQDKGAKGKPNRTAVVYAKLHEFLLFLCEANVLPYDERAEAFFQSLPNEVKRGRANDCRVAAVAVTNGIPVATRNLRDFGKIPGVQVEAW